MVVVVILKQYIEAAYFAPPFLCPMNAQNIFLLIDGFVVSISLLFLFICFFTFMWPGLLLLDLAKNNACFFFSRFDLTLITVCITQDKLLWLLIIYGKCDVSFFHLSVTQKKGLTLTDKDNGRVFLYSRYV